MTRLKISTYLLLLTFLTSCGSSLRLRQPFFVIAFEEVSLVVEDAISPEDVVVIKDGNLRFVQGESSRYYNVDGSGRFNLRGLEFSYRPPSLTCKCDELDASRGSVLVRSDGSLIPVNLLPLIAR
jgi:hypothetical protein